MQRLCFASISGGLGAGRTDARDGRGVSSGEARSSASLRMTGICRDVGGLPELRSYFRWPLSLELAAAFWSPFFSPAVWLFFGLQLPFSPCFLPGVGSKPGQQALALESLSPPALFLALFFAGVFLVSAPLMCLRAAAVLVLADLVAPLAGAFFAEDFFAGAFVAVVIRGWRRIDRG